MSTAPRVDQSVACTAAVAAAERRLRAREAVLAEPVIRLRTAYEAAAGVPALGLWRRWAGRFLDGGLKRLDAVRLAEREAYRVSDGLRLAEGDPDARRVAAEAAIATARLRKALLETEEAAARAPARRRKGWPS